MTLEIVTLQDRHLEDAAVLVSDRYQQLREQVPSLPSRYQDVGVTYASLHDLAGKAPGVVAIRGARLVGFLIGFVIPVFRGKRAVFSPEWANAADLGARRVYEEMYASLAARWVANGCFVHLISSLVNDREAIESWPWLGFGMIAADALRNLDPVLGPVADIKVHRAGMEEIEPAMALSEALQRHMAAAPTFLAYTQRFDRSFHQAWLEKQENALWMAYAEGEAVACLGHGPANPEACDTIQDDKTSSIVRAFTRESARGQGIAATLLNRALEWAREEGYERCAVDFEPMNILATRFWTRHFMPVCYAYVRHVDERIAWAHAQRQNIDHW